MHRTPPLFVLLACGSGDDPPMDTDTDSDTDAEMCMTDVCENYKLDPHDRLVGLAVTSTVDDARTGVAWLDGAAPLREVHREWQAADYRATLSLTSKGDDQLVARATAQSLPAPSPLSP